ncbi:MAG: RIP metalloprotease RseP, partial [Silvanigrellaceae bacterium]|nr:RIP metalloprotease RseP [Silvanigrellaceae bacterium]
MMDLLKLFFSNTVVAFLVLVAVVVFIHELGHFLVGKLFKIKVEEFCIGFGPTAFSFKLGLTDYKINWLPLGGYVRFYGSEINDSVPPELKENSISHAKVYKRALVSFAGPFANFLLSLFIMISVSYIGLAKISPVLSVIPNSIADNLGIKDGDKVLKIDDTEVKDWQQIVEKISDSPGKPVKLALSRNNNTIFFTVVPEPQQVQTPMGDKKIVGKIGISPFFKSPQLVVPEHSLLAVAGFKTGDTVIGVDKKNEIKFFYQFIDFIEENTGAHSFKMLARMILNQSIKSKKLHIKISRPDSMDPLLNKQSSILFKQFDIDIDFSDRKYVNWAQEYLKNFSALKLANEILTTDLTIKKINLNTKNAKDLEEISQAWLKSGLLPGDTIFEIKDFGYVTSPVTLSIWLQKLQDKLQANSEKQMDIHLSVIDASGKIKKLNFSIPTRETYDSLNRKVTVLDFPIEFFSNGAKIESVIVKSDSLLSACEDGFQMVLFQISTIFDGIKKLFTGQVPLSNLGGPIAIAGVAGEAAKAGFLTFLVMMSWISINIGL